MLSEGCGEVRLVRLDGGVCRRGMQMVAGAAGAPCLGVFVYYIVTVCGC